MTNTAIIMLWILALIVISPNILVYAQNVSGQTTQVGQTSNEVLNVTTDKNSYLPGEVINITVKNSGTEPLEFPDSILGLTIENTVTREKAPLFAAEVITTLDSGATKTLNWDQMGSSGQRAEVGNYTASVSTTDRVNASTTFELSANN